MHSLKIPLVLPAVVSIVIVPILYAEDTREQVRLRQAPYRAIAMTDQSGTAPVFKPLPVPAPATRGISLQDCIQEALEHNLDLTIERYYPVSSLYAVKAAQGDYDPVFIFSGDHRYNESAGTDIDPNTGGVIPGPTRDTDRLGSSLGGRSPWGMEYAISGDVSKTVRESGNATFPDSGGDIGVVLTQPLLKNFWIDSTRLRIQVAKIGLKFSEAGLNLKIIDVVTAVEIAYYNLIAAREQVKVREKAHELALRLFAENQRRVEVGALSPLDEKQAESQAAITQAELLLTQQLVAERQNVLKKLLTDDYHELYSTTLEPTATLNTPAQVFNLQDSWSKGLSQRPDLQQDKLNLEQAGVQLKYDHNQVFPRLDVVGSYGYGAGGVDNTGFGDALRDFRHRELPAYSYGALISMPLVNSTARNKYKSAKVALQQALLAVRQTEENILVEIDNAVTAAKVSYQRVDATHHASNYAEAALEAEQRKLEIGKSTSFNVLQLQRNLTEARTQEIIARADYNRALAELARAEGSTLERRAIDVRMK